MEKVKNNDFTRVAIQSIKFEDNLFSVSDGIDLSDGNLIHINILIDSINKISIWYKVIDSATYIIGNNNTREDSIENNDILKGIYCCMQSNENDIFKAEQEILKLLY